MVLILNASQAMGQQRVERDAGHLNPLFHAQSMCPSTAGLYAGAWCSTANTSLQQFMCCVSCFRLVVLVAWTLAIAFLGYIPQLHLLAQNSRMPPQLGSTRQV